MYPPHQNGQGQLPSHWNPQPPTTQPPPPPNGAYPPPTTHINTSLPSPAEPRPDMAALHQPPHQPGPYRLPGPHEWNRAPPPPQDPYRQAPAPNYMNHGHQPPAPRQRTAIACRYCRRRKIRCSGFEATDDGRCSNCLRFNQDCIFTPVSAQTQAFVPAHTVWRGVGQPPPMYGAYGQPLTAQHAPEPYPPQPPRGQPQYLPSPTGPYSAHYSMAPPPPGAARDEVGSSDAAAVGRKRPFPEPHTATLPPPNPAITSQLSPHQTSRPEYIYPEPPSLTPNAVSPASSATSYHTAPPPPPPPAHPPTTQPYYAPQPPRRSSPQSAYSYDTSRASSSPHNQGPPTTPGAPPYYSTPPAEATSLRPLPPRQDGRTPPPPHGVPPATSQPPPPSGRPGMRINDLVTNDNRSSADSNMLSLLNKKPM